MPATLKSYRCRHTPQNLPGAASDEGRLIFEAKDADSFNIKFADTLAEAEALPLAYAKVMATIATPLILYWEQWVHRRVERLEVGSETYRSHHVSMDFTFPQRALSQLEEPYASRSKVCVPVMFVQKTKTPLLNFSLRDVTGTPVTVLTQGQNARIGELILHAEALRVLRSCPDAPAQLNLWECVTDAIGSIVAADGDEPWDEDASNPEAQIPENIKALNDFKASGTECQPADYVCDQKNRLWADPKFRGLLEDMMKQYVMYGLMDKAALRRRTILKYAYVTNANNERAGKRLQLLSVPHTQAALCSSYHFELQVPQAVGIRTVTTAITRPDFAQTPGLIQCRCHVVDRNYYLYLRNFQRGCTAVSVISMRPALREFREAFVTVVAESAVSWAGFVASVFGGLAPRYVAGATIVVVLPGILGVQFLRDRDDEHPLVGGYVRRLKVYVLAAMVGAVAEAGTLAVQAPGSWASFRFLGTFLGWRECLWGSVALALSALALLIGVARRHLTDPTAEVEGLELFEQGNG